MIIQNTNRNTYISLTMTCYLTPLSRERHPKSQLFRRLSQASSTPAVTIHPCEVSVKLFAPPPLLKGRQFLPPPPSIWLKLQAPVLKLPQNVLCPPSAWLKLFLPPFFVGVKLLLPPSLPFCSPPPPSRN